MISPIKLNTNGYLVKWPVFSTEHQPIGREPGAPLLFGADAVGNFFQEVRPVAPGLIAELGKPGLDSLVGSFCQSIGLWMVGRRNAPLDPIRLA